MCLLWIRLVMLCVLVILAGQDVKTKEISLFWLAVGAAALLLLNQIAGRMSLQELLVSLTLGAAILLVSCLTGGKIGSGDGYLFCMTGLGFGFWENLRLFAISLLLMFVTTSLLYLLKRVKRKDTIPFIPFVLAAYLLTLLVGG